MKKLIERIRNQKGVTIPEYAIILALVSVAVLMAAPSITGGVEHVFNHVVTFLMAAG